MRRALGWLGFLLGPVVGTVYYLFLKVVNRKIKFDFLVGYVQTERFPALLKRGCRGLTIRIGRRVLFAAGAITFGNHIFTRYTFPTQQLVDHEMVHVRQYHRLGWVRFLARYGRAIGRVGYQHNPFEQEARLISGV